jgi:hypothetical protein
MRARQQLPSYIERTTLPSSGTARDASIAAHAIPVDCETHRGARSAKKAFRELLAITPAA